MARKLPKVIDESYFLEQLSYIRDQKIKLAFMLGFYQCMRISEVLKLRPEDIDKEKGFIHILEAKGHKDRDIPIMKPIENGLIHLPININRRTLQRYSSKMLNTNFHTLRHSGATYYLNNKSVDLRQIQQLLGHSKISITEIYTHINPSQLKTAFDKVWK